MAGSVMFEARPCYTGEQPYTLTATIEGSGSITGWQFAGFLYDPSGNLVAGAVQAAVADPAARTITVTVAGQSLQGLWRVVVRRTDDNSNLVVVKGDFDISEPTRRGAPAGTAPFVDWEVVRLRVAETLTTAPEKLSARWNGLCAQAARDATSELRRIFVKKGYAASRIGDWSDLEDYSTRLAEYFALCRGLALHDYKLEDLDRFDPRKELAAESALIIGGVATAPSTGESEVGGAVFVGLDAAEEIAADAHRRGLFR